MNGHDYPELFDPLAEDDEYAKWSAERDAEVRASMDAHAWADGLFSTLTGTKDERIEVLEMGAF